MGDYGHGAKESGQNTRGSCSLFPKNFKISNKDLSSSFKIFIDNMISSIMFGNTSDC